MKDTECPEANQKDASHLQPGPKDPGEQANRDARHNFADADFPPDTDSGDTGVRDLIQHRFVTRVTGDRASRGKDRSNAEKSSVGSEQAHGLLVGLLQDRLAQTEMGVDYMMLR
jgi:hypothetical protein